MVHTRILVAESRSGKGVGGWGSKLILDKLWKIQDGQRSWEGKGGGLLGSTAFGSC